MLLDVVKRSALGIVEGWDFGIVMRKDLHIRSRIGV